MFPGTTMLDYIFWLAMGVMQVLVVAGMREWIRSRGHRAVWWQLTLLYLGFATLCAVVAGGTTLMGEYETVAGWYFIGVLGVPVVVALAVMLRLFVLKKPEGGLRTANSRQTAGQS